MSKKQYDYGSLEVAQPPASQISYGALEQPTPASTPQQDLAAKIRKIQSGMATQTQYPSAQERGLPTGADLRPISNRVLEAVINPNEDYPGKINTGMDTLESKLLGAALPSRASFASPSGPGMSMLDAVNSSPIATMAKGVVDMPLMPNFGIKGAAQQHVMGPLMNGLADVKPLELKYGRNPGIRWASDGLTAASKQSMLDQSEAVLKDVGQQLEHKLSMENAGTTVNVDAALQDAVAEGKKSIGKGSDPAFNAKLNQIMSDTIEEANRLGVTDLSKVPPMEAQRLKSAIGKSVQWTGAPFEGDANQVLVKAYSNINGGIEKAVPGTRDLLAKYGDYEVGSNGLRRAIAKDAAGKGASMANPANYAGVVTPAARLTSSPMPAHGLPNPEIPQFPEGAMTLGGRGEMPQPVAGGIQYNGQTFRRLPQDMFSPFSINDAPAPQPSAPPFGPFSINDAAPPPAAEPLGPVSGPSVRATQMTPEQMQELLRRRGL